MAQSDLDKRRELLDGWDESPLSELPDAIIPKAPKKRGRKVAEGAEPWKENAEVQKRLWSIVEDPNSKDSDKVSALKALKLSLGNDFQTSFDDITRASTKDLGILADLVAVGLAPLVQKAVTRCLSGQAGPDPK